MENMDTSQLVSFLKNVAMFAGGFVVAGGWATGAEWETGSGLLIAAIAFGISFYKNRKNKKIVAAVTTP